VTAPATIAGSFCHLVRHLVRHRVIVSFGVLLDLWTRISW